MKILVSLLHQHTTEAQVQQVFSQYGYVASVKLLFDTITLKYRRKASVEIPVEAHAQLSIQALHGSILNGQVISVRQLKPLMDSNARNLQSSKARRTRIAYKK